MKALTLRHVAFVGVLTTAMRLPLTVGTRKSENQMFVASVLCSGYVGQKAQTPLHRRVFCDSLKFAVESCFHRNGINLIFVDIMP